MHYTLNVDIRVNLRKMFSRLNLGTPVTADVIKLYGRIEAEVRCTLNATRSVIAGYLVQQTILGSNKLCAAVFFHILTEAQTDETWEYARQDAA